MINVIRLGMFLFMYHPILTSFLSGLISEELLIFTAVLSGRGLLSFWFVFVFGILGVMVLDSFLFYIGRTKFIQGIGESRLFSKRVRNLEKKIHEVSKKHMLVSFCMTKFIYGTRMAYIIYHSAKELPYKKFLFYDTLALVIWAAVMLPIGWLAGRGFTRVLAIARGTEKLLAGILIVVIIFYIANRIVTRILFHETKGKKSGKNKLSKR